MPNVAPLPVNADVVSSLSAPTANIGAPVHALSGAQSNETLTSFNKLVAYGPLGLGAGLADTVGRSIGVFDDDTVADFLKKISPSPDGFGDYFSRNREPLRFGGEIIGMGLAPLGALKVLNSIKYLREVGKLGSVLRDSTALDMIMGNASALRAAEENISKVASSEVAKSIGLYGARTFANPALDQAKRGYYLARLADTARQTAVFEGSYRVLFNDSETFYPADYTLTDQVKWAGIGFAGAAGLDYAVGRYAVRNLIKAASRGVLPIVGANYASEVLSRPGDRGVASAYFARSWQLTGDAMKAAAANEVPGRVTSASQDLIALSNKLTGEVKMMARDAHPFIPSTQLDEKQLELVTEAAKTNETTLLFASKVGQVPNKSEFYQGIDKALISAQGDLNNATTREMFPTIELDKLRKGSPETLNEAQAAFDKVKGISTEWHLVLESTGDLQPLRSRAANWLDDHSFKDINRALVKENIVVGGSPKSVNRIKMTVGSFTLDDQFVIGGPKNLTPDDWSSVYAMGSRLNKEWHPMEGQVLAINDLTPRFQADALVNLAKTHPQVQGMLRLEGSIKSLRDAEFMVVNEKFKEFSTAMDLMDKQAKSPALARARLEPEQVIAGLNLPNGGLQSSPLLQLFAQARLQGAKDLVELLVRKPGLIPAKDHPLDLLQAAMRETVGETDTKVTYDLAGKMFQQEDVRPVLIASKSIPALSRNDAMLHTMIENRQALNVARLSEIDPILAPILASTISDVGGSSAINQAKEVQQIFEGVVSGRGVATGQDRIADQLPTIKALSLLAQANDRHIMTQIAEMFKTKVTPLVAAIQLDKNRPDLVDFNRIEQSYRHGWEIKSVEIQNGRTRFVLDKDASINRELLTKHFSEDTANEMLSAKAGTLYMPDMAITPRKAMRREPIALNVSEMAGTLATAVSDLSRQSGIENNALRVALGKGAIKIRDFHLPTPEISNENAWFVRNEAGDVVATFGTPGATLNQNRSRAEEAASELTKLYNEPHVPIGYSDVRNEHMFDESFQNFIDHSDQLAKSNVAISGGLAHQTVDRSDVTLKNITRSLTQQFLNIGIRGRAALFEPQINYVRQAAQLSGDTLFKENNIFQRYLAIMFSRSTQSSQGLLGQGYGWAENKMDNALSWLYATKSEATALTDESAAGAKGLRRIVMANSSEQQFRQYKEKYGAWSPFQTTQDWLESTHPEIPHQRAKAFAAGLGKVSATMALRFLDAGTALLNLTGVVATAPAVINALRKLPGELEHEWQARIGAYSSNVSFVPGTKPFSTAKVLSNTIHAFWSGELSEPMAAAAKLGMFEPEYAQLNKVLTEPMKKERGNFGKSIETFMHYSNALADNSEILSRKIAWGMGYKIGKDLLKMEDDKNLYIFANNFINDMIGNYSPRNKPGMFQGALGLPLGAFQTYMFNYYRRMYGYLERKDYSTLAAAYAAQASLFGTASVPGWDVYNRYLFSNDDGSDTLANRLDRTLPTGVSELVLNGTLSSIPKLFGSSSGIAFYPRGSVDWTQVPANPTDWSRVPSAQFLSDGAQAIYRTTQNFMGAGGFSLQEQEEILANFTTNRAIKFIMEQVAGAKTDRTGQVWDAATNDALHVAAGLLGSQTSEVRRAQNAYNSQQLVERHQEALRTELNQKTRAMMRGGEFDVSDLQDLVFGYIRSGGNPAYFGQWLRNTVETSFIPKADKKLAELASSGKMTEFMNLLAALQQNRPEAKRAVNGGQ